MCPQVCPYLGLVVFQSVGLVHHQAGPVYGAQDGHVDGDQLVGGQQDVELDRRVFLLEDIDARDVKIKSSDLIPK